MSPKKLSFFLPSLCDTVHAE